MAKRSKACEQSGITAYVPKPNSSSNLKRGLFTKEDFSYEPDKDCYRCPAGKELSYRFQSYGTGSADAHLSDFGLQKFVS